MTEQKHLNEVKVKEVSRYLKEALTLQNARKWCSSWMDSYYNKYFGRNSSPKPILHAVLLVGLLGYIIEYPHLRQDAIRKYH
jgi:hypothetical protein